MLHTSDWHLGVTVRGESRAADHDALIAELCEIARAAAPDLIVHTGDLFDGHRPPMHDFGRAIRALRDLAAIAPVVLLAGNHDSPVALDVLGVALEDAAVHVLAKPVLAEAGAVSTFATACGAAKPQNRPAVRAPEPGHQRFRRAGRGPARPTTTRCARSSRRTAPRPSATLIPPAMSPCSPRTCTCAAPRPRPRRRSPSPRTTPPIRLTSSRVTGTSRSGHIHVPQAIAGAVGGMRVRCSRSTSERRARRSRWWWST
ncbi:MAG: exonuclease subunit SbcD [Actinobacteria bacterium]|nr:exonuclease subunit SbcD [Actinomycetota bacterium]